MSKHTEPLSNRFGLVDERVRTLIKKNQRGATLAQQNQIQNPTERAAAIGGTGAGIALGKLAAKLGFKQNEEDENAEAVEAAMGRAQAELKALPDEERAKGIFKQAIQEREILIEELIASDLRPSASIVQKQIMGLMTQEQKFAKGRGEVLLQDQALTRSQLETKARQADEFAADETQRLVNVLGSLDLSDPVQAAKSVQLVARIDKLTAITGLTEFDIPYDEVTVRRMEMAMTANTGALDGFLEAQANFNPKFLELGTKVKNWFVSAVEVAGLDLPDDVKAELREYTQFRQITSTNLNAYIKAITGAQMSNPEAIRLARDVPGIGDSPTEYKAKVDKVVRRLSAIRERSLAALAVSSDAKAFRRIANTPLEQFMDQGLRANEHTERSKLLETILGIPSQEEVAAQVQGQQQDPQAADALANQQLDI